MDDRSDDTVRLRVKRHGPASPRRRAAPWIVVGVVLLAGVGASGWWLWPAPTPVDFHDESALPKPARQPDGLGVVRQGGAVAGVPANGAPAGGITLAFAPPIVPPTDTRPSVYAPPLASEGQILADAPERLAVYRFEPQPSVVVLQFPSLADQAHMLNRVAALIEKAGFPRDRVLSRATLDERIRAEGGSPDTFYYGHDYDAAQVLRFLALATDLDGEEQRLAELVQQLGWGSGTTAALISLVRASSTGDLDASGRAAILRHEVSHGFYFTDPAYAAFCHRFWSDTLTGEERAKFKAFLGREGYDTTLDDLMVNETQAYLMHTPDKRFFNAAEVGLTPTRIVELRQIFLVGMPPGWLRDHTTADASP